MKKILYLGYYAESGNNPENRASVLAAVNKMSYIAKVLNTFEPGCIILSASHTLNSTPYKEKSVIEKNGVETHYLPTLKYGNRIQRVISRAYSSHELKKYLMKNLESDDVLVAYHSLAYLKMLGKLKSKKHCRIILEVEELYSDVQKYPEYKKLEELIPFVADGFIFPTSMLNDATNPQQKPFITIHGTYQVEVQRICKKDYRALHGWDQDKTHVVYAGTFDPRKGGAIAAAAAAVFLPDNYHIHILGFGSEKEKADMKELVEKLSKKCCCSVSYDGLLSGDEYIQFIQSCDIGLSTQNPDAAFNATSFPSKILSYMASGLRVVSIRIPAIESSAIGDYMYYYDTQTPEEIAKAIMGVDMNDDYDGRSIIRKLDLQFRSDIQKMLEELP